MPGVLALRVLHAMLFQRGELHVCRRQKFQRNPRFGIRWLGALVNHKVAEGTKLHVRAHPSILHTMTERCAMDGGGCTLLVW